MFDIINKHHKSYLRGNRWMEYKVLKEKYHYFIYKNYQITEDAENIYLKYEFEIENLAKFNPVLVIAKKKFEIYDLYSNVARNVVFNLGMVEAISYYKLTCSKYFVVKCGKLNEEQIAWYQKLIYLGLGEFRYINHIQEKTEDFVQIMTEGKALQKEELSYPLSDCMVPIGGGKDSNVTLELLKKSSYKRFGFRINLEDVSRKCAQIAGLQEDEIIEVKRKMDSNLIELNKQGFLNGHTPFSAMVAWLTYFVATIFGKKYIVLSNEDSANESNIKGENINHQYSKTLEFENDFRDYVKCYICPNGPEYFSFLRPINELQIAKLFSEQEQYHEVFKSCNIGSKEKPWKWCCNCAKCLFPYTILSPFLEKEKLINIFGEDLFEKENLLKTFVELCGYSKNKPFECVGTYEEVCVAVTKTIQNRNEKLPFLLQYYKENFELIDHDLLHYYSKNHNLPSEFDEILKGKIFEC